MQLASMQDRQSSVNIVSKLQVQTTAQSPTLADSIFALPEAALAAALLLVLLLPLVLAL